jgi:hypothetical protein
MAENLNLSIGNNVDTVAASVRRIFYTADVIRPDGSDTFVYGEATEEGHGATLESGYISPDWSRSTVYENRDDVAADVYADDDGSHVIWLAARIADRLGTVEDNGDGTLYGQSDIAEGTRESIEDGISVTAAAHVEGFSPEEISLAVRMVDSRDSVEQFMRNIAAGYQSPGYRGIDFAIYASSATITDNLSDAIQIEQLDIRERMAGNGPVFGSDEAPAEWLVELSTLLDYVRSEYVVPWSVGHNDAGYLPESTPSLHLSYADAINAYREDLESAADHYSADYSADGCDCCSVCLSGDDDTLAANPHDTDACGGGDTCEPCIEVAAIEGYLSDGGIHTTNGKYFGQESEQSYGTYDSHVYWLTIGEAMTYGEYLAITRD